MSILIKNAKIYNNTESLSTMDILIESGKITSIKKSINPKTTTKIIDGENLCVSIGWLDMQATFCDPALEHKETIQSGSKAAAAGGFTGVCVHGYNQCAISNKSTIDYILNKADKLVNLYPIGSITNNTEGKDLSELFDMKIAGAYAYSDYKNPLENSGLVLRALQYSDNIGATIITHCVDEKLSGSGQMNEGPMSTSLGLKGMPALSEELMIERNISVLEYGGGKLHIPTISTEKSVELIKKAKSKGLNITAGVAAANLYFDDSALFDFDTNYKVNPPLRSKKDLEALKKGLETGVIDVIVSDHCPQDSESKDLEFDLAEFGIINLQTTLNCLASNFKSHTKVIDALTINPRKILGIEIPQIKEGADANLTIFSLTQNSTFTEKTNFSKSKNSPFMNKTLPGKVIGVINGTKSYFN